MSINASRARLSTLAALCIVLAACGGDDDSGTASLDTPPAQPPTAEPPPSEPPPVDEPPPVVNEPPPANEPPPVAGNFAPTISGTPALAVVYDKLYQFQPEAADDDGDILHFSVANAPPWTTFEPTTGELAGTPSEEHIGNVYEDIVISVTDGAADAALDAYSITVQAVGAGSVELSWLPPTENTDGSALMDLAGYKIYWGTVPGEYPESVTIDNPGLDRYVLENLVPNTYYFVATAFNANGTESEPTEEVSGEVS